MKLRTPLACVLACAGGLALVFADDAKTPTVKANSILPVPDGPKVSVRADLKPQNFTETVDDLIRVVDPDGDVDDPDFETKFVKKEPARAAFEMVYVPGGTFQMGSPDDETDRDPNEGPRHAVTVRPFWMAKFETTWEVFDLWYKSGNLPRRDEADGKLQADSRDKTKRHAPDAITRPTNPYVDDTYYHGRAGKPALCMSHHAAMVYCHWLRLKTKKGYRLPTEAEWEYACRAGHAGPFGFDHPKEKLADYAWYKDNSATKEMPGGTTHEPGKKKPNKFGLYDLHGNLAEWTLDQYDPAAYAARAKDPAKALTFIPPTAVKWGHVVRGGSWKDEAKDCRAARRVVSEKDWMQKDPQFPRSVWWLTEMDTIGFRVVLPVDEYPELVGLKPLVPKKGE